MSQLYLNLELTGVAEIEKTCRLTGFRFQQGKELCFSGGFNAVYGFGERFDAFNQIGLERKIQVFEKFTNQGADTYLPVPVCLFDAGFGVYIDTKRVIGISTRQDNGVSTYVAEIPADADIHFFHGSPSEIMDLFSHLTGRPKLPPDWGFGLWMSTHRWNSQEIVEQQIELAMKHGMKPSVVVIEAWSDEATFYRFDSGRFPDPAGMIRKMHEQDIKCVLWQAPVLKKLEEGQSCPEHDADCAYAVEHGYVALNPDGTPYTIPEGHWFGGSMIPDFTNPDACNWWFGKRQYLLDMGVDGFKTDGGEFVYDDKAVFHDGSTGADMQNGYALVYTKAYADFAGDGRVLFSRAGFTGSQTVPLHWAGDQESTWEEMRHVLTAGLNAGLSGIPFWGFDIAGFAGALPPAELYLRAFAMACFSPVMQWHSEPLGGQFAGIMPSKDAVNDRSPWHIAEVYDEPRVIDTCRFYVNERLKLLPYLLEEAKYCAQTGRPLMAPIFFDAHTDKHAYTVDDQYMLGRKIMVAPVLREGTNSREVYFPAGKWRDYWTGEVFDGRAIRSEACEVHQILVYGLEEFYANS